MAYQRVEVISGVGRRRHYSDEEKQRLVTGAFQPGVTVVDYARQQGVCPSLLHRWRRQARRRSAAEPSLASVSTFVPVTLAAGDEAVTPTCSPPGGRSGLMEIDLGGGRCLRVDREVDAEALRRVLQVLDGR
jgi:transposase